MKSIETDCEIVPEESVHMLSKFLPASTGSKTAWDTGPTESA